MGFFSKSTILQSRKPLPLLAKCGACGLYKSGCESPKMPATGKGRRKVMIIGEAPGRTEDRVGRQFVGDAGQFLKRRLDRLKVDMRRDVWLHNALSCRPVDNVITNPKMVEYCRPRVLEAIIEKQPEVVILLGPTAIKSVIGFLWKEDVGNTKRWLGWKIPCQRWNCWVCPTWHPSYLMRKKDQVADMMFFNHLNEAFNLEGRPWEEVPDYKSKVKCTLDVNHAAKIIRRLAQGDRPVALDYETNMLKPDTAESYIVCCSVSDGETTLAFPWHGEAIKAMFELVRSRVPKVASNMKYEERWTRKKLRTRVRNWDVDTMLAAHVLDNRPDITSIKFQSFVQLGQESYNDHIAQFLKSKEHGGYGENRITEVAIDDLMAYCGMDSLLEWEVARKQRKEFKSWE